MTNPKTVKVESERQKETEKYCIVEYFTLPTRLKLKRFIDIQNINCTIQ